MLRSGRPTHTGTIQPPRASAGLSLLAGGEWLREKGLGEAEKMGKEEARRTGIGGGGSGKRN